MPRSLRLALLMASITVFTLGALFFALTHGSASAQPAPISSTPAPRLTGGGGYIAFLPVAHKEFHFLEPPTLGWATGPEGVLLRWRWPKWEPKATAFAVYRDGVLVATVRRVTDEGRALRILGPHLWAWLRETYSVTTVAELHSLLDDNAFLELGLADQKYPVALVRGLGYLDTDVALGETHTYRVEAITTKGHKPIGEVTIEHKEVTPLPKPTGLTEVEVVDDALMGSPDWARAQQNRKGHAKVFLRWDLPTGTGTPNTWVPAYDVYRSTSLSGPFERINIESGEDKPVVPMPSYTPPGETGAYQQYPYFYADTDPNLQACHPYYYRVAPRDLLGHPRDWSDPSQRSQFSDFIRVVPPDTEPPPAPYSVTATADNVAGVITITWHAVTDAVKYVVYRSTSPHAAWPGLNRSLPMTMPQWVTMTTTSATQWVDTGAAYEQRYWYMVRALDAGCPPHPPNMSAPSEVVSAILHDRTPPKACQVEGNPRLARLYVNCPDASAIRLYCSFDGGPEVRMAEVEGESVTFNLSDLYTPARPVLARCRVVPVDDHGNAGTPSRWVTGIQLAPPHVPDPSPPIITGITTTVGGDHGWTAHLTWEALDAPCLAGFRVYRETVDGTRVTVADESTLDEKARAFDDTTVQWGVVYTYTVAAYRPAAYCGPEKEVSSQPMLYRVTQPPDFPGRMVTIIPWNRIQYTNGGTRLVWMHQERRYPNFVVFRSVQRDRGYVALTPPFHSLQYLDSDAHHSDYWYMVVGLDPATGEPVLATHPCKPGMDLDVCNSGLAREPTGVPHPSHSRLPEGVVAFPNAPTVIPEKDGLPPVLYFGTGKDAFTLDVAYYYAGSTLQDISGVGDLVLRPHVAPDGHTAEHRIRLAFSHISATSKGQVLSGHVDVPRSALPLELQWPNGFRYDVTSLRVDKNGGSGGARVYLPDSLYYYVYISGSPWLPPTWVSTPYVDVAVTFDNPTMGFEGTLQFGQPCSTSATAYFRVEDLPWRVIPAGTATATPSSITLGSVCTLYEDRYNGTRPTYPDVDANEGLVRPTFDSSDASIGPGGLNGTFVARNALRYTTAFPYGFMLRLLRPTLTLENGLITGGSIPGGSGDTVAFRYFDYVVPTDPYAPPSSAPTPNALWRGYLTDISIGPGGSIYAKVHQEYGKISWLHGGFTLQEHTYELFIPPVQSLRAPWQDVLWPTDVNRWSDGTTLEPGLNFRTPPSETAHLVWSDCVTTGPVVFGDDERVNVDIYVRRAGVSDLVEAEIPTGSPLDVRLDGYQTRIQSFRFVFFDNDDYDRDFSGAIFLPGPTDDVIPFYDAQLDDHACIEHAKVAETTVTPVYWQVDLFPKALEFRPPDPDPSFEGDRGLWLLGTVEIPHMAPWGSDADVAPIPLDTAFKPNGDFYSMTVQYDAVNYAFDGFYYLLSGVRLSNWPTHEAPGWVVTATLDSPPTTTWDVHGFVQVDGQLMTPVFGALESEGSDKPPHIYVLGWDDYVGFSDQPRAKRKWTEKVGITWNFDLLYAHHHSWHRGVFVGFRSDDLKVLEMDQAVVLNSATDGAPAFDIFLGLSSGTAALRALAEVTQPSLPSDFDDIRDTLENWRRSHFSRMDAKYLDLLNTLWNKYGSTGYRATTEKIDAMEDKDIPTQPAGGRTKGKLDDWGIKLKKMRGDVQWVQDTDTGDWDFDQMRLSLWLDVKRDADNAPLAHADRLTFRITRDGDYILEGEKVKSKFLTYGGHTLTADFALDINVDAPSVEGGVTVYDFKVEVVKFEKAGATFGVGEHLYYLGALADAKYERVTLGGAFLFGEIRSDSIVLRDMGFGDLLDHLAETGASLHLVGGYVRVYGDIPVLDLDCLAKASVGGEVALWYFNQISGCDAYGGRLRGYVHGEALCFISGRGDLSFEIYRRVKSDGTCFDEPSMNGWFWMAAGIGWCEPEDWDSWETRWWGDSWCWTFGAIIRAHYNPDDPNGWSWDYDVDYE